MSEPVLSRGQFATCAAYLAAGCGRQMGKEQMEVYYDALNDVSFEVLKACCKRAIQEQRDSWLPSVGMIRGYAAECTSGLLPQSSQEWSAVRKAVSKWGAMRRSEGLASLSPLAAAAADSVGWDTLCMQDADTVQTNAAQFRMAYENAARREMDLRRLSPELRPVIANQPVITPRLHNAAAEEVRDIVDNLARTLKAPEDPAA